jgi:hypothetical protein
MKKYTILFFFALTNFVIEAQDLSSFTTQSNFTKRSSFIELPRVVGKARYFNNDSLFIEGELVTKKRHYKTELGYRFDQIERSLEVQFESGKQIYIDVKDIVLFKLYYEDHTAVFLPLKLPKAEKKTLLQVIYRTPTLQLYRDVHKRANIVIENWNNGNPDYHNEVMNDYHYYFRKTDKDNLVEVYMKAKSFAKVLPKKKEEIKRLFKQEKEKGELTVSKICKIMKALDDEAE